MGSYLSPVNFRSTQNGYNPPDYKKRLTTMALGTMLGTGAGLIYFKNKKKKKKKLWFNSLEAGALVGITTDILGLLIEIPKNIKTHAQNKNAIEENLNIEPYKNKDFFVNLYSGEGQNSEVFLKYQKILTNKKATENLFKNKEVLKASQEALLEVNNKKIAEALKNNDSESVKDLELINSLLQKSLNKNTSEDKQQGQQNVSFGAVWDIFHAGNESLKQKAEISVNRYAASAAGVAATLANAPGGDVAALTFITKNMCKKIFKIYGCTGGYTAAIMSVAVGSVAGTLLALKGATIWPGAGNAINATVTYTLHELQGRALIEFLEENKDKLGDLSDFDIVAKFIYRMKMGLSFIKNEKIREFLENMIDKCMDFIL